MWDRGYIWFAHGERYAEISKRLAGSIKRVNQHNKCCVITDDAGAQTLSNHSDIDRIQVLKNKPVGKFDPEWKAFRLSPFTHTIKLEADMWFTQSTDWWWNYLHQWDMVQSYHCRNYRDDVVKQTAYRKLFKENDLPDVYSGLTYFRRSQQANKFFKLCRDITENWHTVKEQCLINCHDAEPTTDVVYALANKMLDPLQENKIEYEWFNFVHNKNNINGLDPVYNNNKFLQTYRVGDAVYLGGYRQSRIWHYYEKDTMEQLDARIF